MMRLLDVGWTEKWEAGFRVESVQSTANEHSAWVGETAAYDWKPWNAHQQRQLATWVSLYILHGVPKKACQV